MLVGQGEKNGKKGGNEGMKLSGSRRNCECCQNGYGVRGGFTGEKEIAELQVEEKSIEGSCPIFYWTNIARKSSDTPRSTLAFQ